jgi:excisionase family DNA binding protein
VKVNPPVDLDHDVLTLDEACLLLKRSRPTVVKRFKAGLIPGVRDGREYRFLRSELLEYLRGGSLKKAG